MPMIDFLVIGNFFLILLWQTSGWAQTDRLRPPLCAGHVGLGFGLLDRGCGTSYPSATLCIWTFRECSTFGYFMASIEIVLQSLCLFWCRLWTSLVHLLTSVQAFRTWPGPLWIYLSFLLCEIWFWFSDLKIANKSVLHMKINLYYL